MLTLWRKSAGGVLQTLTFGVGNGNNECTVWLSTKVSGHRNLGARSLVPGTEPTDDSLSGGSPKRECCRCGFDVALRKQREPDRRG